MSTINTHLGQNLPWIAYKNGHNALSMPFTYNDAVYDISNLTFTLNIRQIGGSTIALALTQGSGITNGGATGILSIALTQTQASTTLPGYDYFYELVYTSGGLTYPLIQGILSLVDRLNPGESTTTSIPVEVSIGGSTVDIDVNIFQSSSSSIYESNVSLSSAQILALSTSPVIKAINKPGDANKYNAPISIDFVYTAGSTPYTRNSLAGMILSYEGTTTINLGAAIGSILTQSVSSVTRAVDANGNNNITLSSMLNKDIYLILNGGSFTLGDGTLKLKILYHTIDLN